MKHYLHLADSGLVLSDLSLRLYDLTGDSVSTSSITMEELTTPTSYVLDEMPDVSIFGGLTLTFENPPGVFHAERFGSSVSQPSSIIIPIREVFEDPVNDLVVVVLRDGVRFDDILALQLSDDGEYLISGWSSPSPLDENWSIRWTYNDQVFSIQWVGTLPTNPSHYISIFAVQSPFPLDSVDPFNRVMFSCNFDCQAVYPVTSFEYEMAKVISNASLGTLNVDMYVGNQWTIPDGDGPYIGIKNTGGRRDDPYHAPYGDGQRSFYQNLSFQTIVRATDYDIAKDRIYAIYQLFNGLTKLDVSV